MTATVEENGDGKGYYNITLEGGDKSKLSEGAATFYESLSGVIDSDKAVKVDVVYGDKNIVTGHFGRSRIDIADIEKFPNLITIELNKIVRLVPEN